MGASLETRSDGRQVATGAEMLCPVCRADEALVPDCAECVGRGRVDTVPWADRPWDEVVANLWVGGHDCQPAGAPPDGRCIPTDEFDLVVSLYQREGFGPSPHVRHLHHRMGDTALDPGHHDRLDELAAEVVQALAEGRRVLVRCQAGLNRGSLVAALAMVRRGWDPADAIARIREVRSPYALFNEHFVDHLMSRRESTGG